MTPLESVAVGVLSGAFGTMITLVVQHRLRRAQLREAERTRLREMYGTWVGAFTTAGRAIRLLQNIEKNVTAKQEFAREYYQASETVTRITWEICLLDHDQSRRDRVLAAHIAFTQDEDDVRAASLAAQLLEELSESGDLREAK